MQAPPLCVQTWLNAPKDFQVKLNNGKVTVLHAFQMLCPGCILHGLPQAERIYGTFSNEDVQVIGLHSVFEHHASMNTLVLEAFISEFHFTFPIAVDQPSSEDIPLTMKAYQLRGTPSLIIIDAAGTIRHHQFGRSEDMVIAALIAKLIHEPHPKTIREDVETTYGPNACTI